MNFYAALLPLLLLTACRKKEIKSAVPLPEETVKRDTTVQSRVVVNNSPLEIPAPPPHEPSKSDSLPLPGEPERERPPDRLRRPAKNPAS